MADCMKAAALLRGWDDILVLCHASPDGDTLGSAGALVRGLGALGKRAFFACGDKIDEKYSYLFEGLAPLGREPAHIVSVDVATPSLLGSLEEEYAGRIDLAIDHHSGHTLFARESWVEPDSAANSELIYLLLQELGVSIDKATAECLYTGISTDTGCFRYANVTPRTHRIAARLLELGADGARINREMHESKSKAQLEAERILMESMAFSCGGKCAMVQVPLSIYERTGVQEGDLEGMAALPRQIKGVLLGVTLKEKENGLVKGSVRSNPPANAREIGESFGGGGHPGAAGFTLPGMTLSQAAEKVEAACREQLLRLGLL